MLWYKPRKKTPKCGQCARPLRERRIESTRWKAGQCIQCHKIVFFRPMPGHNQRLIRVESGKLYEMLLTSV